MSTQRQPISQSVQLVISFVVPTAILFFFSDESKLGPLVAMGIALLLPVGLEVFTYLSGRKSSWLSLFAIIGILSVGGISLLGLSEEWLAMRRALFYLLAAVAVASVARFRPGLLETVLNRLVDMSSVGAQAKQRQTEEKVLALTKRVSYTFAALLLLIGIWSYILTLIVMTAQTGSSQFNAEYAQLRLVSLPYVTLPLLVGTTALLTYLLGQIEKLTGLAADQLIKRKQG